MTVHITASEVAVLIPAVVSCLGALTAYLKSRTTAQALAEHVKNCPSEKP